MRFLDRTLSFARNVIGRRRVEQDLDDEIACHVELLVDAALNDGLNEAEARRRALLELGGVEQVKEQVREARAAYFFITALHDLHRAVSFLLKAPSFSAIALLTLAASFGAAILIFCVARAGFVSPLNYADPNHLLQIYIESQLPELSQADVSFPRFQLIRSSQDVVTVAACAGELLPTVAMGVAEQINVAHTSSDFFELLKIRPFWGRLFLAADDGAAGRPVVILSHRYWQKRFSRDPAIIGKDLIIDGLPTRVVGVLPDHFEAPFGRFDAFVPRLTDIRFLGSGQIQRGAGFLKVIARPKAGATIGQIQSELAKIDQQYRAQASANMDAYAASRIAPLRETIVRGMRPLFYVLIIGVSCVVTVAVINVANLLLARLARRRREIALRYALGASYGRVALQLTIENILLVFGAIALGMLFAWVGLNHISVQASELLRESETKFDGEVICFGLAVAFITTSLFAMISVIHARHGGASEMLLNSARSETESGPFTRFHTCLVVTQVALSLVLVAAAVLVMVSFIQLQRVNPGFDPQALFVTQISPPFDRQASDASVSALYEKLIKRLKATPEIAAAAAAYGVPLARDDTFLSYTRTERPVSVVGERAVTWYRCISPDYFATMRIPLSRGRDFSTQDDQNSSNVVILSETTARLLFGDTEPIGRKIICGGTIQATHTVIGVVGDVRSFDLALPVREEMYFSMFQASEPSMKVIVRAASPQSSAPEIESIMRLAVAEVDPGLAVGSTEPMLRLIAHSITRPRIASFALACFAALAILVASVGVYSIVDCAVSERTREIGLRLALGASRQTVFWLIIGRGLKLVTIGLISGTIVACAIAPLVSGLLFNVSATDSRVFTAVILLLVALAFLASYLPARRAMTVAPIVTLGCD